ncbi:MAG: hypothetical protein IKC37_04690 [Clostridia bacterium]|nr:hypothetical protein [Clostridia bacterium]
MGRIIPFDNDKARLKRLAEKYYDAGEYVKVLRFLYKELYETDDETDVYIRIADAYERMGLYGSAISSLFRALDACKLEEDLPDIYEGLGANFMHLGIENQAAYYYNRLIDSDDTLTEENKYEIAQAFAKDKRDNFHFVYPPKLADFSKEMEEGSKCLKNGDCKRASAIFSLVPKGNESYAEAKQLQAVAQLLDGDADEAERICLSLLEEDSEDAQTLSTLSAVYLEQGRTEESKALAERLSRREDVPNDVSYKIATVCCENGLPEEAYKRFCALEKEMPYDARMQYFKAVSAYHCGRLEEAESALDKICMVYPDAAVAEYYLRALRAYRLGKVDALPEFTYFYRLPQEEREVRCRTLLRIGKYPKAEAEGLAFLAHRDGYFRWCFDEMDGMDKDLQYVAIVVAEHAGLDSFLREVLLDYEVHDGLKVELIRALYRRNEEMQCGVVLCNIYKKHTFMPLKIGRKKRRLVLDGYARAASRFAMFNPVYAGKLKRTAEETYSRLVKNGEIEFLKDTDAFSAALCLLAGIHDMGDTAEKIAPFFETEPNKVMEVLIACEKPPQQGEDNEID